MEPSYINIQNIHYLAIPSASALTLISQTNLNHFLTIRSFPQPMTSYFISNQFLITCHTNTLIYYQNVYQHYVPIHTYSFPHPISNPVIINQQIYISMNGKIQNPEGEIIGSGILVGNSENFGILQENSLQVFKGFNTEPFLISEKISTLIFRKNMFFSIGEYIKLWIEENNFWFQVFTMFRDEDMWVHWIEGKEEFIIGSSSNLKIYKFYEKQAYQSIGITQGIKQIHLAIKWQKGYELFGQISGKNIKRLRYDESMTLVEKKLFGKIEFGEIKQCIYDPIKNNFAIINEENLLYFYNPTQTQKHSQYENELQYLTLNQNQLNLMDFIFIQGEYIVAFDKQLTKITIIYKQSKNFYIQLIDFRSMEGLIQQFFDKFKVATFTVQQLSEVNTFVLQTSQEFFSFQFKISAVLDIYQNLGNLQLYPLSNTDQLDVQIDNQDWIEVEDITFQNFKIYHEDLQKFNLFLQNDKTIYFYQWDSEGKVFNQDMN